MLITIRKSDNKVIYFNQGNLENNPDYEEKNINIDFMPSNIDNLYYDATSNSIISADLENKIWNGTDWVDDIAKLKSLKSIEIYNACEYEMQERNYGMYSTEVNSFIDCREIDVLRLATLIRLKDIVNDTSNIDYICYDNSIVNITYVQFKQIYIELTTNIMNMLYYKHYLYGLLNNASTKNEINAINWIWPIPQ